MEHLTQLAEQEREVIAESAQETEINIHDPLV
jgi:hypothetical protein